MADTKISALTDGTTANATDRIPVARDPTGTPLSRYITPGYIKTYLNGIANAWSVNGAVSAPASSFTGTWYSGGTATTTKPLFLIEPTGTTSTAWSTSGTGLGINAASGFSGNLIDIQKNGVSQFSIRSDGFFFAANGAQFNTSYITISQAGGPNGITLINSLSMGWVASGTQSFSAPDTAFYRDEAYAIAQRTGTNAQKFRVYGTWTDASNYERGALNMGSDYVELAAETAGTGDDNLDVRLTPAGTGNVRFGSHSAIGAETVTGFITIKDSGGTARKIAVVS